MSPRREMHPRRRMWLAGVLALALCTALAMTFGAGADAKKKKGKGASVFQQTLQVNGSVPNDAATGPSTPLNSTILVGKKFKGKVVGDLNVTGITTTGSGTGAADDLGFRLIAPNGHSMRLIGPGIGDQSIGPLTLDDDTSQEICDDPTPPCDYGPATLNRPFAGTANTQFLRTAGTGPLSHFNGLAMKGAWTLQVWDDKSPTTSVLNSWGLQITAARPVS